MSRLGSLACLLIGLTASVTAQEWTRFRGPNGAGVSSQEIPLRWTLEDAAWQVELPGVGHSSPVLWGERLFVTSGDEESGQRRVLCLHADTGEQFWQREFPAGTHRKHALNSFATATPVVDSRRVYVCWATPEEFVALALDHEGNEVWRKNLGTFNAGHGFGVSPILYGDLLIVPGDQGGTSTVTALHTASGEIRWRQERDTNVAYSTPCVFRPSGGPDQLIFTTWKQGIEALDPETGRTLWNRRVFDPENTETSIGSPVVVGDLVIGCAGWLTRTKRVVAVRPLDKGGEISVEEVFRVERAAPLSTTPVISGDLMILWSDEGIVTCVDSQTGEKHWQKRVGDTFYGSPVVAGGYVYCMSAAGECVVLKAAKEYELVARNPVGDGSHSTPAVARGKMYLRSFSSLIAVGN